MPMFRKELADKILRREKTQTRRMPSDKPGSPWYIGGCKLKPGRHYAIVAGRGTPQIGRILVEEVSLVPLVPMPIEDILAEGFTSLQDFLATWDALHKSPPPVWPEVWRVVFRLYEGES